MKIIIAVATMLLTATPALAQVACYPNDHACQINQWQNQAHENAIDWFNQQNQQRHNEATMRQLQMEAERRAQEQHTQQQWNEVYLLMKMAEAREAEEARKAKALQRYFQENSLPHLSCEMGNKPDGSCWRPHRFGDN